MATREEIENLWRETYQELTSDQRRLADDITTRSETIANRTREWATELEELTRLLAGTPCKSDVALFWIRLHGAMTELVDEFRGMAELAKTMQPDELERNLAKHALAIFNAASAIPSTLDEREIVLVDYLRQRAAHLRQRGYGLRGVKGRIDDKREIAALGKKAFSIAEIDEMRAAVLREYGTLQAFAVAVGAKVRPAIATLVGAFDQLYAERSL